MEQARTRTNSYMTQEGYEGQHTGTGKIYENRVPVLASEYFADENHGRNFKDRSASEDVGGPMSSWKLKYSKIRYSPYLNVPFPLENVPNAWYDGSFPPPRFVITHPGRYYIASDFLPNLAGWHYPWSEPLGVMGRSSMNDLITFGTKSIGLTAPNRPSVNVAVSIGELFREGIPSMVGSAFLKERSAFFKNLGGEYLNVQFGWKPFISDLLSLATIGKTISTRLDQWARDSGRVVRRQRTEKDELQDDTYHFGGVGQFCLPSGFQIPGTSISDSTIRVRVQKTRHFSSAFTYYVPPADQLNGVLRYESMINHLIGTRITPEVLWNLAPWTWLADWFANIGDVITNISLLSSDELVMHYGYVSEETRHHELRSQAITHRGFRTTLGPPYYGYAGFRHEVEVDYRIKDRIVASPFGFGLTISGLSSSQMAILGALGLSRGPRRYSFF